MRIAVLSCVLALVGCDEGDWDNRPVDAGEDLTRAPADMAPPDLTTPADLEPIIPTHLVFLTQPTATLSGATISPAVQVALVDDQGRIATTATNHVSIGFGADPANGQLAGTVGRNMVNGVATFADLRIDALGTGYTLKAHVNTFPDAESQLFYIAASRLSLQTTISSSVASGSALPSMTVALVDVDGHVDVNAAPVVSFSILNGPTGGTLAGNVTANSVAGVATFNSLFLDRAGTYVLQATTNLPNVLGVSTPSIVVTGSKLKFVNQPTTTRAGDLISPALQVQLVDTTGAVDSTFNGGMTAYVNPGCGSSIQSVLAHSGVAMFDALEPTLATPYCAVYVNGGPSSGGTDLFTVVPGANTGIAFGPPGYMYSYATYGGRFRPIPSFVVRQIDSAGNTVDSGAEADITVSLTNPNGANLTGTVTRTTVGHVATFDDLIVDKVGSYSMKATAGAMTASASLFINGWSLVSLLGVSPIDLQVAPSDPNVLYALSSYGYYSPGSIACSTDGGATWTSGAGFYATAMAIDRLNPAKLFVTGNSIARSLDAGTTFTTLGPPNAFTTSQTAITISVSAPTTLYAVGGNAYKSTDGGASWTQISVNASPTGVAIDPTDANTVYITASGGSVLKSIDGGATWTYVANGLPNDATGLVIDPQSPQNLLMVSAGGVYKSIDGGNTWTKHVMSLTSPGPRWLRYRPGNSSYVYAQSRDNTATGYLSSDGGDTWTPGSWAAVSLLPPLISPADPMVMFDFSANGFYMTTSAGL